MSEQVVVTRVSEPNEYGWYTVELEDGRATTTNNEAIAKHAEARIGNEAEARINEVVNGDFTNVYLNEFDGISDRSSGNGRGRSRGGARRAGGTDKAAAARAASNLSQEVSWAYGRAVELLMASGDDFTFPTDEATTASLKTQAESLLTAKRDTAKKFK